MSKPNELGKRHVLDVCNALRHYLNSDSMESYIEPVQETVKYIAELYPDIQSVRNKFETDKPDFNPDLILTLHNKEEEKLNLFNIKRNAAIQPKNLGAKSFLENYFMSQELQEKFNAYFSKEYELYLQSIMEFRGYRNVYDRIPELKKKVLACYPKFEAEINPFRRSFLFSLREYCFQLMKDEFNNGTTGIENAFKELMMLDTTNIITRYTGENKCFGVEEWKSNINIEQEIQIYKKGNDTIGIRSGTEALTIRFKFESGPTSSVKLATSYECFPAEDGVVHKNLQSIKVFEGLLERHKQLNKSNDSNAVGKCNEAMVYYRVLVTDPKIHQVDEKDFQVMLESYSPYISSKTLLDIQQSSKKAVEKIDEYLKGKYQVYQIESIQLVPDNYLKDRLDTSDMKIIIKVEKRYVEENLSLKAISKSSAKITVKNPGAGTILGPLYFDTGSLTLVTDEAKVKFNKKLLTHQQCLEMISAALGESLQAAKQEKLRKGLAAIRGTATTIITDYVKDNSLILEHDVIKGVVEVYPKTPSTIQTTLRWNEKQEELSLRVKFSKGQDHGWSSMKLACEYRVEF
ncbi:hypothetical protein [Psychrobacillus vulpis]|uniref:Uncharacterized protein n=1 Tax=Psychrobacillus vulpis TaxID=2325572 RepID=A0A544TMG4_9BACI|nr:hypothetical protein [Psychrobacillus vulpis]TQR18653.1 hypothetical protein FG384_15465 [Psychrobacillus vulpis]